MYTLEHVWYREVLYYMSFFQCFQTEMCNIHTIVIQIILWRFVSKGYMLICVENVLNTVESMMPLQVAKEDLVPSLWREVGSDGFTIRKLTFWHSWLLAVLSYFVYYYCHTFQRRLHAVQYLYISAGKISCILAIRR